MRTRFSLLLLFAFMMSCTDFFTDSTVEYTVKRGDTLSRIAKTHGVTVAELRTWNGISGDLIEVGQQIQIRTRPQPAVEQPTKIASKKKRTTATPRTTKGLSLPPKKRCLDGPSLDDLSEDEPDIQASMGLSHSDIQGPMSKFLPNLSRCFEESWPEGRVLFEMTAGCNGRVSQVVVLDSGGLKLQTVECMRTTLAYVAFPAHDMPDGMTFQYPVVLGQ